MVTFATVSLFALIVMSISADLIALTEPDFYFKFSALALATSLLTLFTVIPMYLIDMFRQGVVFAYIIVEIVWLSILWVLWLSSGSYAAWTDNQFIGLELSCDFGIFGDSTITKACHEIKAVEAFSFLTWIILMAYTGVLLFLAIRAQERGNSVWAVSVRDEAIFHSEPKSGGTLAQMHTMPTTVPQTYPPGPPPLAAPTPDAVQV